MRKYAEFLVFIAILGGIIFWFLTKPSYLAAADLANIENGDVTAGEQVFWAGGCGSCHARKDASGAEKLILGGGHALKTPFGIFFTPNISPDPEFGLGKWSGKDFANAMLKGVSPDGSHYYPSFPYGSYARMKMQDIADLWAFMKTVPAVASVNKPHELPLPFQFRRGLGLWKLLFVDSNPVVELDTQDESILRGRYLVEGVAHCGECHTPRNIIGGLEKSSWLGGAVAAEGKGNEIGRAHV